MLFFKPVYRPLRGPARLVAAFAAVMLAAFAGVTLTALAAVAISSSPAQAQSENQSALEMLQDGLDALADQQRDLAAQFFEQLIMAYPGTTQADRAEHELKALGQNARPAVTDPVDAEPVEVEDVGREPAVPRARESIAALRVRFSVEAGDRVFFSPRTAQLLAGGRELFLKVRRDGLLNHPASKSRLSAEQTTAAQQMKRWRFPSSARKPSATSLWRVVSMRRAFRWTGAAHAIQSPPVKQ